MYDGWYLVAFEDELDGDLTPVSIGDTPLMLVADGERARAFDAVCPHRGAHLAYGGRLHRDQVICPFHGKHITLGEREREPYCVREYPLLGYGGMFFVRLSERHENGLGGFLDRLAGDHVFAPAFALSMRVDGDLVIENVFDDAHFRSVHGVQNDPKLSVEPAPDGSLVARGTLQVMPSPWQRAARNGDLDVPLSAHAFSPQLVFSHMGGHDPYWVITGTTPTDDGCVVRQALAVPAPQNGGTPPEPERLAYLARACRGGLEADRAIWEHLRRPAQPRYGPTDAGVVAFRGFCDRFVTER